MIDVHVEERESLVSAQLVEPTSIHHSNVHVLYSTKYSIVE